MDTSGEVVGKKTHAITWISLIFIILTFLFFLASVFILEFAVTTDSSGDIVIPWYYWFFFAGAGIFLVIFVILQAIPVPYAISHNDTKREDRDIRVYNTREETLYSLMR